MKRWFVLPCSFANVQVYSGIAMLTPGIGSRRFTCYIASDSVALRLWAKQPGKWFLMGLRIAIPDPSRGKMLGRKVLGEEENLKQ